MVKLTSFYTNHIKMRNYYNIYRGIQENTGEYKRIECVQCHAIKK